MGDSKGTGCDFEGSEKDKISLKRFLLFLSDP